MLHFQHIEYLWGLAALPGMFLLYYGLIQWKKRNIAKIGDENLVKLLLKNYSPEKFTIKFILIIIAFTAGILALTNLRSPKGVEKVTRKGIDVMIALDVSKSMLAQDVQPARLDRAKQLLYRLIDQLNNDRIGLVIFAGKAYLQMPLTVDHSSAKMFINAATPDAVPTQGTVISQALDMCLSSFNKKEKKYKSVILITDGEDHDDGSAAQLAAKMADEGVVINTIGIGSPQGAVIMDPTTNEVKKDEEGNTVISKLNEQLLMDLAKKTGGIYQLYDHSDRVVNKLAGYLNTMDQRAVTDSVYTNYRSYYPYFLLIALLLLIIEFNISKRINNKYIINNNFKYIFIFFLFLSPLIGLSQSGNNNLIKKGNEAYEKKQYDKAVENYTQAIAKNPANMTGQYNLGNALYKNKKSEEAIQAYDKAIQNAISATDKARAFYNKGVVLQNSKKLEECIEAYKNALKLTPNDDDARQNLQKALQKQKEQQQKQQKQDQKKDDQKSSENDQQQKQQEKPENNNNKKNQSSNPDEQSKLSKQEAEEKLKALLQNEKNLQEKLRKVNAGTPVKPEKDW